MLKIKIELRWLILVTCKYLQRVCDISKILADVFNISNPIKYLQRVTNIQSQLQF